MDLILASFGLGIAAVALGASVVSLALHYARRNEHPDVTRLDTMMQGLREQQLDVLDKFEHWVRRDRVRVLRDSRTGEAEPAPVLPISPAQRKMELRARLAQFPQLKR